MNSQPHYRLFDFPDIHSHVGGPGRVVSIDFATQPLPADPEQPLTIGVHPWHADADIDWEAFESALADPAVVGIGEAGLDTLRGPDPERQTEVFERQIELAEKHRLPLVIHSVRSNHRLLQLKKRHNPTVPWVIHGFRGNVEEALRMLQAGFHLSLGQSHNPEVGNLLPADRIHRETDEETPQ